VTAARLLVCLCLCCLWVSSLACVAAPIRDPSALEYFEARVRSEDGWELSLFRIPPSSAAADEPHFGTPVLLAHSTAVNRYNFMLTGSNLARFLSERGFDVWMPELRGDRSSRSPHPRVWRRGEWTVEDMVGRDIPAVLDHIKEASGRDQVWWIGQSLGGILGYLTLQGPRSADVAGLVAIGAPGSYENPSRLALRSDKLAALLPRHGQLPARALARFLLPIVHLAPENNLLHAILNYENVKLENMVGFVGVAMENISIPLLRQYSQWIDQGHITSADGKTDYTEGLAQITVPALLMAGRVDHVVPVWAVRAAYERISSTDKSFVVLGRGWGTRHDYGHADLVVGSRAKEEVFPLISEWLESRIGGLDAPTGMLELHVEETKDPLLEAVDLEDGEPSADPPGTLDDPHQDVPPGP